MELLKLIPDTDQRLRTPSMFVDELTPEILKLCEDLFYTMEHYDGIGIAAPQCGKMVRIICIKYKDFSETMINPNIIYASEEKWSNEEGCLSFPNVFFDIERSKEVEVVYCKTDGTKNTLKFNDTVSVIVQHEIEHLNGITMRDHISKLKWDRINTKAKKNLAKGKSIF